MNAPIGKLADHPLILHFEPRQRDGTIVCHRRYPNGESVRPIVYNIDSSQPTLEHLTDEERASWIAARDLMGWPDQSKRTTRFR